MWVILKTYYNFLVINIKTTLDVESDSEAPEIISEKPKAAVRGRTRKIDINAGGDAITVTTSFIYVKQTHQSNLYIYIYMYKIN